MVEGAGLLLAREVGTACPIVLEPDIAAALAAAWSGDPQRPEELRHLPTALEETLALGASIATRSPSRAECCTVTQANMKKENSIIASRVMISGSSTRANSTVDCPAVARRCGKRLGLLTYFSNR